MYVYAFEKFQVGQEAKEITKSIYKITTGFPDTEKFGLVSQLRRASVSICSNIAEGTSRRTFKNQAYFTTIAYGSTVEIINQLILCFELKFISETDYTSLRNSLNSLSNKLNAVRTSQVVKSDRISNKQINK